MDLSAAADIVIGLATVALVGVTWALAIQTKNLADRSASAHVVATIEPNQWLINHTDIIVANTGNAAAYDIQVSFDPAPATQEYQKGVPLRSISVLKPAQQLSSYLCEFAAITNKTFSVKVQWRASPGAKNVEVNSYSFSMDQFDGVSRLGAESPLVQIAEQVKQMREDWRYVASGSRKLNVDIFDAEDRAELRRILDERYGRNKDNKPPESS